MTDQANLLEGYITEDEYCAIFGITKRTAQRARRAGIGPAFVTIHRQTFYAVPQGRRFLADSEIKPRRRAGGSPGAPGRAATRATERIDSG